MRNIKRKFGPSGSGQTDDYWDFAQRIRVGPARIPPDEISAEEFKEILERQGLPPLVTGPMEKQLTTVEFLQMLRNPKARTTYQTRSRMDRIASNLEYFQRQEDYWWANQQIQLLRIIDEKRYQDKLAAYNMWAKQVFIPKVEKVYKHLKKTVPKTAEEFLEYAYKYMKANEPQRRARGSMVIIEHIRRLIIRREYNDLEMFNRELAPLFGEKEE